MGNVDLISRRTSPSGHRSAKSSKADIGTFELEGPVCGLPETFDEGWFERRDRVDSVEKVETLKRANFLPKGIVFDSAIEFPCTALPRALYRDIKPFLYPLISKAN